MSNDTDVKIVNCPTCKKECEYSPKNTSRPFCSDKCRLIDLGEWADEGYSLKAEEQPTPEELEQAFLEKIRH